MPTTSSDSIWTLHWFLAILSAFVLNGWNYVVLPFAALAASAASVIGTLLGGCIVRAYAAAYGQHAWSVFYRTTGAITAIHVWAADEDAAVEKARRALRPAGAGDVEFTLVALLSGHHDGTIFNRTFPSSSAPSLEIPSKDLTQRAKDAIRPLKGRYTGWSLRPAPGTQLIACFTSGGSDHVVELEL